MLKNHKKLKYIISFSIIILILCIGTTYAINIWNSSNTSLTGDTMCFDVDYTSGSNINMTNMTPSLSFTKDTSASTTLSFKRKDSCELYGKGTISANITTNSEVDLTKEGLKYRVVKNYNDESPVATGSITQTGSNTIYEDFYITDVEDVYTVYFWFDANNIDNTYLAASFSGEVNSTAISVPSYPGNIDENDTIENILYARFYYYNQNTDKVEFIEENCEINDGTCTVNVPSNIPNNNGKYGNTFIGFSNNPNSMETTSLSNTLELTQHVAYYATYSSSVNYKYYDTTWNEITAYRNSYFNNSNELVNVISNSNTSITPVTQISDNLIGYANSGSTTVSYENINAAANSTTNSIVGVYKYIVNYQKGENVVSIGKTTDSCTFTSPQTSCTVTTPTINPIIGGEVLGWYDSSNNKVSDANTSLTITSNNQTYTAKATGNNFMITLDNNGATSPGTPAIYVIKGDRFSLTSGGSAMTSTTNPITKPTKTGYTFNGYYEEEEEDNGTGTQYIDSEGKLAQTADNNHFSSNGTLYAKWTEATYTITLDNQNATTAGTTTIYETYDIKFSLTSGGEAITKITAPTKTGYTFGGYYEGKNGGGTQYINAESKIIVPPTTFTSNETIFAYWIPKVYTITLNNCGGTPGTTEIYLTYGSKYSLTNGGAAMTTEANPINIPTLTGYSFKGYYTGTNGTGTKIINEYGYIIENNIINKTEFESDGSLYAYCVDDIAPTAPTTMEFVYGSWTRYNQGDWTINDVYAGYTEESKGPSGATDEGSGIAKYQISKDDSTWKDFEYDYSDTMYLMNTDGIHTRYFRAVDNAGNAGPSISRTAQIDRTAPTTPEITTIYNLWESREYTATNYTSDAGVDGTWTTASSDPQIDFGEIDNISGITGAYVRLAEAVTSPITIQIYYAEYDSTYSEENSETVTMPSGKAQLVIPFSTTGDWTNIRFDIGTESGLSYGISYLGVVANEGQWNRDRIRLQVETDETGSGIANWQYTYAENPTETGSDHATQWVEYSNSNYSPFITTPYTANRNQLTYLRACDQVGNCSPKASTKIKIDTVAPTMTISEVRTEEGVSIQGSYSDSNGVQAVYFGTDNPETTEVEYSIIGTIDDNPLPTEWSGDVNNTYGGEDLVPGTTYYFSVIDIAGNITTQNITLEKPIYVYYNVNGGTIQASAGGYAWTTDTDGFVMHDGIYLRNTITSTYRSVSNGFANYNNSSYMNITRSGYTVNSSSVWASSTEETAGFFNQTTNYTYEELLTYTEENTDHYRLNLYVNWVVNTAYTDTINGNRMTNNNYSSSTQDIFYITTCQPGSVSGAKCNYTQKNKVATNGTILRSRLTTQANSNAIANESTYNGCSYAGCNVAIFTVPGITSSTAASDGSQTIGVLKAHQISTTYPVYKTSTTHTSGSGTKRIKLFYTYATGTQVITSFTYSSYAYSRGTIESTAIESTTYYYGWIESNYIT